MATEIEEDLIDKKVAQEVIEAVEREEESIINENKSTNIEINLDIDKDKSNS